MTLRLLAVLLLLQGPAAAAVLPAPETGFLGQLVARILEQSHYTRRAIDDETSRQALRNLIDSFDYNHLIFEDADIKRFESLYGATLDDRVKQGDASPAYEVYNLFVNRLEGRLELVKKLCAENLDFSADETVLLDRREAPWPATPEESLKAWRQRIKYELLQERLNKAKPEEQVKTVVLRYERLLRSVKEYDSSDVLQAYLTAFAHAFDPHSDYLNAPQKENFDIGMRLSLVGIGAVLRSEDGYAKIVSLVTGGPADVDKRLKPNDKIEAVGQGDEPFLEVVGMKLDRLVQMIRGEKGTKVRLRVIPADALNPSTRLEVSLIRDEIKLTEQEAKAKILELPWGGKTVKAGLIDLPSFYADMKSGGEAKSTTRDVARLIAHLKKEGVEGLVLDLRRNGGGSLSEAVALTGLFIREGPVVQIKDSRGGVKFLRDHDPATAYSGPLVVLTSRMSASASEIVAGALQDYGRAVVVGEKSTFGKGTVQSMLDLSQYLPSSYREAKAGALKITIQKFYRVNGDSTQNRGVVPDIRLPSLADEMEGTESSQKNALAYDQAEPAGYARADQVSGSLPALSKASAARVAAAPEFLYIRDDIERLKDDLKRKTVSLNESKRLAEKSSDEARELSRKKERAARKTPELKSADVTLPMLDALAEGKPWPPPVAASTATASVAVSTASVAVSTASVSVSTAAAVASSGEDYEKAPPAPDAVLEETLHILSDLVAAVAQGEHAATGRSAAFAE